MHTKNSAAAASDLSAYFDYGEDAALGAVVSAPRLFRRRTSPRSSVLCFVSDDVAVDVLGVRQRLLHFRAT